MTLVLVASSDARLRENLVSLLHDDGLASLVAVDGLEAFRAVFQASPDAVLIDLTIDEVDGLELVRMLRAASPLAIVAVLGIADQARGVAVLDLGADDVIRPSTPPSEILARVKAAIRRSQRVTQAAAVSPPVVQTGDIAIDRSAQTVTKAGVRVSLSRTEYRLLDALASRAGQVAPHRFLLSAVWGNEYVDDVHYLRVYVGYLRSKLEDDPHAPRYIRSEWGVGYRLVVLDAVDDGSSSEQGGRVARLRDGASPSS